MGLVRLSLRLGLFALALAGTSAVAGWVTLRESLARRPLDRTPYARACFSVATRSLGLKVRCLGQASTAPVLFVSNHVSWSDIPVLGGIAPLRFLSKAEVARWPLIGWLAGHAGTLFIQRGGGRAAQSREHIRQTLADGQSVLVFPEGTTSDGRQVLPFHSRLLPAAASAGVAIQPVSIGYLRDGEPDPVAPFIDDDAFESHLLRLLRQPAAEVVVIYHEPVAVAADDDMNALAGRLEARVAGGLAAIYRGRPAATSSSVASLT